MHQLKCNIGGADYIFECQAEINNGVIRYSGKIYMSRPENFQIWISTGPQSMLKFFDKGSIELMDAIDEYENDPGKPSLFL